MFSIIDQWVKQVKTSVLVPALFLSRDCVLTHRNPAGDVEYGDDNDKSLRIEKVSNLF